MTDPRVFGELEKLNRHLKQILDSRPRNVYWQDVDGRWHTGRVISDWLWDPNAQYPSLMVENNDTIGSISEMRYFDFQLRPPKGEISDA